MNEEVGTITNRYVTIWTFGPKEFFFNVIRFDGKINTYGEHRYSHKRSARRAATALAKKLDVSYRQDLEYVANPHAFIAKAEATV